LKKPSIDREDNDGNYCVFNCRFIEQSKNSTLMNIKNCKRKPVLQYDLQGNFIGEYKSIAEASFKIKGKVYSSISGCVNGRYKISYGFIWKFKGGNNDTE